jgi:hypothetical protein
MLGIDSREVFLHKMLPSGLRDVVLANAGHQRRTTRMQKAQGSRVEAEEAGYYGMKASMRFLSNKQESSTLQFAIDNERCGI